MGVGGGVRVAQRVAAQDAGEDVDVVGEEDRLPLHDLGAHAEALQVVDVAGAGTFDHEPRPVEHAGAGAGSSR